MEDSRAPLVALAILTGLRLLIAASTDLVADEAYYWTWSRHLAAGYFNHPPAIAWLIRAGTSVLGDTSLGVRGAGILAAGASAALLLPAACDRWLLVALLATTPMLGLGSLLGTPDVPLLVGWSLALAGAVQGGRGWIVAGIGVGLAGLGKLTGYGLLPLLLVASWREARVAWPGLLLAIPIWFPNLAWNAGHDWVSWRFQLDHGLARGEPPGVSGLLQWLGAQAGLLGPGVAIAAAAWWMRPGGDRVDRVLWWTSFPAFAFFAFSSTRATPEPNWAAGAYLGVVVALSRATGTLARGAWLGAGIGAVLTILAVIHVYHPLVVHPNDPVGRLGEGRVLAASVEAWGSEPVAAERYQEAAVIAFYTGLETSTLAGVGRPSQFDFWPTGPARLIVRPYRGGPPDQLLERCPSLGAAHVVTEPVRVVAGVATSERRYQVYPCP